jgi:hypothetical protein
VAVANEVARRATVMAGPGLLALRRPRGRGHMRFRRLLPHNSCLSVQQLCDDGLEGQFLLGTLDYRDHHAVCSREASKK